MTARVLRFMITRLMRLVNARLLRSINHDLCVFLSALGARKAAQIDQLAQEPGRVFGARISAPVLVRPSFLLWAVAVDSLYLIGLTAEFVKHLAIGFGGARWESWNVTTCALKVLPMCLNCLVAY